MEASYFRIVDLPTECVQCGVPFDDDNEYVADGRCYDCCESWLPTDAEIAAAESDDDLLPVW